MKGQVASSRSLDSDAVVPLQTIQGTYVLYREQATCSNMHVIYMYIFCLYVLVAVEVKVNILKHGLLHKACCIFLSFC